MSGKDLLDELEGALDDFLGKVNGAQSVFIATLDGHMLLEKNRMTHPVEQLVPMAGSVLGISETLATQILQQELRDNIILMDKHILGLLKIKDKEDSLFLGIICDRLTTLGSMLNQGKLTIKSINQILEEQNFF